MYLTFPDAALEGVLTSATAVHAVYGDHAVEVMVCVCMLLRARRLEDLLRFAFLRVVTTRLAADGVIDVLHGDAGLSIRPVGEKGAPVQGSADLRRVSTEYAAVIAVLGAPALASRGGVR